MERRTFLKTSSLALLGLSSCKSLGLPYSNKKLGVQIYTVRDAAYEDIEKTFEQLAELGYTDLEIFGYDGKFFGKTAKEFRTILKNTGQKLISSHHTTDLKISSKLYDDWEIAAENIVSHDGQYMVYAYLFPQQRTNETFKSLPEIFERFGEISTEGGIQFAYHNHDFEFEPFEKSNLYDFILNETSEDLVKMELDLFWITKAKKNPSEYFKKYPGRFPLWHVKDMNTKGETVEVGNGIINFDEIFAERKIAGLEYWFVEQDDSKNPFQSLKISRDYLRSKNF